MTRVSYYLAVFAVVVFLAYIVALVAAGVKS
jgi:hypothetical protein